MVHHVVAFQSKTGCLAPLVAALGDFCEKAKREIDGVEHASVGENFSPHGGGFDSALVVGLRDRAALESYASHPLHESVVTIIRPLIESRVVVDYEV